MPIQEIFHREVEFPCTSMPFDLQLACEISTSLLMFCEIFGKMFTQFDEHIFVEAW